MDVLRYALLVVIVVYAVYRLATVNKHDCKAEAETETETGDSIKNARDEMNLKYKRFIVLSVDACNFLGEVDKIYDRTLGISEFREKLGLKNGIYRLIPVNEKHEIMYEEYWVLKLTDDIEYDKATDKFVVTKYT